MISPRLRNTTDAQTLSDWLDPSAGTSTVTTTTDVFTAFVVVWYDQSGHGRDAYQPDTSLQPIFDKRFVDFNGDFFMLMNVTSFPRGNSPYSWVVRHGNISELNQIAGVFGVGDPADSQSINLQRFYGGYQENWWNNDINFGTYAIGNVVSETYDQYYRQVCVLSLCFCVSYLLF